MGVSKKTKALLFNSNGLVVHEWERSSGKGEWLTPELFDNGDIIVVKTLQSIMRLDVNSQIIWELKGRFHHNSYTVDNLTYALLEGVSEEKIEDETIKYLDNYITTISESGEIQKKISLFSLLKDYIPEIKLQTALKYYKKQVIKNGSDDFELIENTPLDFFHTNSIRVLQKSNPGLWEKGDILISIRHMNALAIVDIENLKVKYFLSENYLSKQHDAQIVEGNKILLFNNGNELSISDHSGKNGYSSVLLINPISKKIVWSYDHNSAKKHFPKRYSKAKLFYSSSRSSVRKFRNGYLIYLYRKKHLFFINEYNNLEWSLDMSKKNGGIHSSFTVEPVNKNF